MMLLLLVMVILGRQCDLNMDLLKGFDENYGNKLNLIVGIIMSIKNEQKPKSLTT